MYIRHEREAAGIKQLASAYAALGDVLGGPQGIRDWMMLQNNIPVQLAKANADAIRGLQPKINVWTTGAQQDAAGDSFAPIKNIMQSLPPLFSTIQDQTGMMPPAWLAQMPSGGGHGRQDSAHEIPPTTLAKHKGINGS
jgi:flotillin